MSLWDEVFDPAMSVAPGGFGLPQKLTTTVTYERKRLAASGALDDCDTYLGNVEERWEITRDAMRANLHVQIATVVAGRRVDIPTYAEDIKVGPLEFTQDVPTVRTRHLQEDAGALVGLLMLVTGGTFALVAYQAWLVLPVWVVVASLAGASLTVGREVSYVVPVETTFTFPREPISVTKVEAWYIDPFLPQSLRPGERYWTRAVLKDKEIAGVPSIEVPNTAENWDTFYSKHSRR
jgi:hypothetical protein